MVDTTLPNTGATDQTNGGNPNTWGNIADANFLAFDNRFGAIASVATTGGNTNLSSAQEVVALIKATGVLASNATFTFSGRGGLWLVQNNTTGAYTLTCKISGQTGITIDQGETKLIYFDGTDMAEPDVEAAFLPLTGGTMTGAIAMGTFKVTGLGAATTAGDAVRYEQVFPSVFQPLDATLTALAALTIASGKVIYGTGTDAFSQADSSAAGRTLWNYTDPNADRLVFWDDSASAFASMDLGTGLSISTTTLSLHATLSSLAGETPTDSTFLVGNGTSFVAEAAATARTSMGMSANGASLVMAANYAAMRTLLDLEAGTDFYSIASADAAFQPKDADLTALAAVATTAAGLTILTFADPNADRIPFWDDSAGAFGPLTLGTGLSISATTMSLVAALSSIGGLTPSADTIPYYTGASTAALATFTATARSLLDDASTAAMLTTLGAQPVHANLTAIAALAVTDGNIIVGNGSTFVAESGTTARASLGLGSLATASTVSDSNWSGTDLSVANGGTGSSTAAAARTALDAAQIGVRPGVNAQTGTSYTLVLADAGKLVTMASGSSNTIAIPLNSSVAFEVGTSIDVQQIGTGTTSIDGVAGVTVNGVSGGIGALTKRWGGVSLTKIGTDTWTVAGAIGTVA